MFSKVAKMMLVLVTTLMATASLYAIPGNLYLSTITDPETGSFSHRSLLLFNEDGTMVVSDSAQQGSSFSPFGLQHGYWEKHGDTLEIKTVDFTYPKYFTCNHPRGNCSCENPVAEGDCFCCDDCLDSQQIAVLTGKLKKNHDDKWEGKIFLTFFDLRANNINDKGQGDGPSPAGNIILDYVTKP